MFSKVKVGDTIYGCKNGYLWGNITKIVHDVVELNFVGDAKLVTDGETKWISIDHMEYTEEKIYLSIRDIHNVLYKSYFSYVLAEDSVAESAASFHYSETAKYLNMLVKIYNTMTKFHNVLKFHCLPENVEDFPLQCLDPSI